MLDGLGTFAGGLAEGIRTGQEMSLGQKPVGRTKKNEAREVGLQHASMDEANFYREKRNRLRAANNEIAAAWQQNQQGPVMPGQQKQLVPGLEGELQKTPAALGTQGPGLSGLAVRTKRIPSDEIIGKRMLTGNLLENPHELTRMVNIYKKYGLLEEMAPWMNEVYTAKKKGIPDALNFLLAGDAKGAKAALERGGVGLADEPVYIATPDERKNLWRFRLKDGDEKEIDLEELVTKFLPSSTLRAIQQERL